MYTTLLCLPNAEIQGVVHLLCLGDISLECPLSSPVMSSSSGSRNLSDRCSWPTWKCIAA